MRPSTACGSSIPRLPAHIDRLLLERVRVGQSIVDLRFMRSAGENVGVSWAVREGPLIVESAPGGNNCAQ